MDPRFHYPDHGKLACLVAQLNETQSKVQQRQLLQEIERELIGRGSGADVIIQGAACNMPGCQHQAGSGRGAVYYPGLVHHTDGNPGNNHWHNLAMVCPSCQAHIRLARYGPAEVQELKTRGLRTSEIAKNLGITRERIRQILQDAPPPEASSEKDISRLVEQAQARERREIQETGIKRRVTDRRTLEKRIRRELERGVH